MGQVGEGHPRKLLARVAHQLPKAFVVLKPAAVDGDQGDADRRVLKKASRSRESRCPAAPEGAPGLRTSEII